MITLKEEILVSVGGKVQKFSAQHQISSFEWKELPLWMQQSIRADLKLSLKVHITETVSTITETKKFS